MFRHVLVGAAVVAVVACGRTDEGTGFADDEMDYRTSPDAALPGNDAVMRTAQVRMMPTAGNAVTGVLVAEQVDDGVRLTGRLMGLPPNSDLGFHVHEFGDCSAPDASSAGGHFNPTNQPHGDPDDDASHFGDMENLDTDVDGEAEVDVLLEDAVLDGPSDRRVEGRAVIVHSREDDYETQPSGDSGTPIACGVIGGAAVTGSPDDMSDGGVAVDVDPAPADETAIQTPDAGL
ncbi:MAG: superoxide dismutase family protein [Acidobacteriota bacterium]|jgi:Cu-Zn family superoxide dismutase